MRYSSYFVDCFSSLLSFFSLSSFDFVNFFEKEKANFFCFFNFDLPYFSNFVFDYNRKCFHGSYISYFSHFCIKKNFYYNFYFYLFLLGRTISLISKEFVTKKIVIFSQNLKLSFRIFL